MNAGMTLVVSARRRFADELVDGGAQLGDAGADFGRGGEHVRVGGWVRCQRGGVAFRLVIPVLVTGIQPSTSVSVAARWIPAMNAGMTLVASAGGVLADDPAVASILRATDVTFASCADLP